MMGRSRLRATLAFDTRDIEETSEDENGNPIVTLVGDGKIDSHAAAYSALRVWVDATATSWRRRTN